MTNFPLIRVRRISLFHMKPPPKHPIPLNFRTAVFCFLQGSALSIPVGLATRDIRHYEIPRWLEETVMITALVSLLLLPVWTLVFVPEYRSLRLLAAFTFLLIVTLGVLFPAL